MSALRLLPLALALVSLCACEERPKDGLDDLLVALQEGDADRAWQRFDTPSRVMMEEFTVALAKAGQAEADAKTYLLKSGRFSPQATERIEEVKREGDTAVLAVIDFEGKTEHVTMRWEDNRWRLHLDGAGPASAREIAKR